MGIQMDSQIYKILLKAEDAAALTREEALTLMRIKRHTREAYALMETANRMSRTRFGAKGENHFQHRPTMSSRRPMDLPFLQPNAPGRHF